MARKAYCAECGREVWLGRDGGCQFGHSASQLSGVRDANPKASAASSPAAYRTPVAQRPPVVQSPPAAQAPAASAAMVPPPPSAPFEAPARFEPTAAPFEPPLPAAVGDPVSAGWGNTPDDFTGGPSDGGFDYVALPSDVNIGDTECLTRRCVARILDNLLAGFVGGLVAFPFVTAQIAAIQQGGRPTFSLAPYILSSVLSIAYFVGLPLVWQGRTVGKFALGIAVTDLKGAPPSLGKLVLRELAMLIDGFFYGIVGLVIASKSPRSQRIGDVWAETVVVRTR